MGADQADAIVVQIIEGGCGGFRREDRVVPGATGARTTMMGRLQVLAGDAVLCDFPPERWVSWRPAKIRVATPPQARRDSTSSAR